MRRWFLRATLAATLTATPSACAPARPAAPAPERITARDVAGLLGYPDTTRLVIIHADDAAITPGGNRATLAALATHGVSSASILATTPWLDSLAAALSPADSFDLGVHLALTSETPAMRWDPAAPRESVPSLVDASGHLFLRDAPDAKAEEIVRELGAQLERVRAAGINVTHLDSHQGALLYRGRERFEALRALARQACLPIPVPETFFKRFPYLARALDDGQLPLADLMSAHPEVDPKDWAAFYDGLFETMRPGVTLLVLHLGDDSAEERLAYRDHTEYGADWRARDDSLVASGAIRAMALKHGVQVITWRDIARIARICPPVSGQS